MAIKKDNHGNYFQGNTVSGTPWSPELLEALMSEALGSPERALLSKYDDGAWRIDWRTNEDTTEENLTGAIDTSLGHSIQHRTDQNLANANLAQNARFALSVTYGKSGNVAIHTYSPYLMRSGVVDNFVATGEAVAHRFTSAATFWATARDSMVAFFIKEGNHAFFIAQGLLLDARLPFPGSQFSIAVRGEQRLKSAVQNGGNLIRVAVSGDTANFEHIRKSDDTPMHSECELYFRQASDGNYLGYAANLWKLHVDEGETAPELGDIIVMDLSRATGYYKDEGEVPCIVVGRYGTTNDITLAGDYIVMRIAD